MEFNVIQLKFESLLRSQLERTTANLDLISINDL